MSVKLTSYLLLHFFAALLLGISFRKLYYKNVHGIRAYLLYTATLAGAFLIAGIIGELSKHWQMSTSSKWLGAAILLVTFLTLSIKKKREQSGHS